MPARTYHIEALRCLSNLTPGLKTMTERTVDAWQVLDTVTTTQISWQVFEAWFHALPAEQQQRGLYRMVEPSGQYGGGTYYEYVVESEWTVKPAPIPDKEPDTGEASDVAQVA